jgi:hypothetical protein
MVGVRAGGIATAVSPLFSTIILSDSAQPIINEPHDASFICQMFICSAPRFAFVVRCSALVATGEAPFLKDRLLAYPSPKKLPSLDRAILPRAIFGNRSVWPLRANYVENSSAETLLPLRVA